MIRLGITGHQTIPDAALRFVTSELEREISVFSRAGGLLGITSLAAGTDQLFATLVLRRGGALHVVLPASCYETTFDEGGLRRFRNLLSNATAVEVLAYEVPSEEAFYAAGQRVADLSDTLLAVWDGLPSRGFGGTADVVRYAQESSRDVRVIWPGGIER